MTTTALPSRLHHTAAVTRDLEATRHFYEDLLGLPLVATWCERETLLGKERTYCHAFFAIGDGGALAFFQFADPADHAELVPDDAFCLFRHQAYKVDGATQAAVKARVLAAGITEPRFMELEHGYCHSIYITDPNGCIIEFTVDAPGFESWAAEKRASAHTDLARWLAGDHTPNNQYRAATHG